MDGEKEKQMEEKAGPSLEVAVEWALNGAIQTYDSVAEGLPVYVVRVVQRDGGVHLGRSKEGYADALCDAYRKFLSSGRRRSL